MQQKISGFILPCGPKDVISFINNLLECVNVNYYYFLYIKHVFKELMNFIGHYVVNQVRDWTQSFD